jgi:hypothetical protein
MATPEVKEIKSQEDLDRALARLDVLWSARPGDELWEERKALVDMICDYEEAMYWGVL